MLRSTSQSSGDARAQLLAACESDEVAASKADVGVRLDSAQRKISTYSDVQADFVARDKANKVSSVGWRW